MDEEDMLIKAYWRLIKGLNISLPPWTWSSQNVMSLDHAVACIIKRTHETKSLDRIAHRLIERVMDPAHVNENKDKVHIAQMPIPLACQRWGIPMWRRAFVGIQKNACYTWRKLALGSLSSFANAATLKFLRSYSSISCSIGLTFIINIRITIDEHFKSYRFEVLFPFLFLLLLGGLKGLLEPPSMDLYGLIGLVWIIFRAKKVIRLHDNFGEGEHHAFGIWEELREFYWKVTT